MFHDVAYAVLSGAWSLFEVEWPGIGGPIGMVWTSVLLISIILSAALHMLGVNLSPTDEDLKRNEKSYDQYVKEYNEKREKRGKK